MRQIILDTETTGMPAKDGHRIIEIGCVEMIDRQLTGNNYHQYINPQRMVDLGAFQVHGISDDFLSDKLLMSQCIDDFLAYIHGAELVIHNAPFDVGFLNYELDLLGKKQTISDFCTILDTLPLARKKHPGSRVNLDALTKRYGITSFNREYHGALLDSEILARVYLAMTGGQEGFAFSSENKIQARNKADELGAVNNSLEQKGSLKSEGMKIYKVEVTDEEIVAHQSFLKN